MNPQPLPAGQRLWATLALGMASFMNVLDLTIVNVSIPNISGDLGVAPGQGTWIITSYAVAEAIMLPMTGWLAGRLGQVKLFALSTFMFTMASLLCGMAPTFEILLMARVLQGVFGAAMIPMSQTLMLSAYPPEKAGLATGIWAMTTVAAPIIGPLSGGWLTDNLSWHWVFLINLPVGLLCLFLVIPIFRKRETPLRKLPVDLVGLGLLIVGVGALQIMLDKGNELDWFESPTIVALSLVAIVGLGVFIIWEWYEDHPLVDLKLFTRRNFAVGMVCLFIGTIAFFGSTVVLPLWLQTQMGYTPTWAGRTMALGGVLAVFLGPIVGANIAKVDARAVASFGFTMFAIYAFVCARFTPDVTYATLASTRLIMGVGVSCFFLPLITISLSGIPPERMAGASGLNSFVRNMGSSVGTAVITSLWEHKATEHHARLVENVNTASDSAMNYLGTLQGTGMNMDAALATTDRLINQQAYLLSTNAVLCLCGIMMLALVLPIWLAKGPFSRVAADH